jgi:eukaryotic-like serine/threonine-protein kinase
MARGSLAATPSLPYSWLSMIALRERLQAELGDAYRIESELGGGGMSRVFVAVDTALGRRVVVKVLPPEMAAGVNVERFRREIQLAASLQHPHIVALYAAGEAGDLLYYTMPLVEGESLRARLVRSGQLPIDQVLRVLRDVADALAYAHARGVVHRDIKPDNVLVSDDHAVVTDFGVAKAVSAAGGDLGLTSIGVALGTPAYMSPEQAAGDPQVDHRADIYASGVMGYEMVAGRLPFTASTPQAMLAAHLTQAVEPPATFRPALPSALNALLLRCLAKAPADRIQRADELRAQLEKIAGDTAVVSSGTAAAIRRGQPWRVAVLFGVASALLLGFAYVLMQRLGLPSWVFGTAAVLLAIGFPIVMLTGLFERQRAVARTTGAIPAAGGVRRWFTWRRSFAGGGLAFAGLGVAASGYMAMRLLGIGPAGTLMARGTLKAREPILLAEFENRTTDSTLGTTLTEAFRIDLSQSPTVRLLDRPQIAQALIRMQRPPETVVSAAVAREVAQRTGAKAVVTGEVARLGTGYVLSASVLSADDGAVLTAVRENAADDAALLRALDRLSRDVRERIGESLTSLRETPPLEQVTTASLEALRLYSEAIHQFDRGEFADVLTLLRQAVAIDTGFAMAYRKIAATLYIIGGTNEQAALAATKAFALSDRLPEVERDLAEASYYSFVEWDLSRQVSAYRRALAVDPDNQVAIGNLANTYRRERRYAAAESLALRATGEPAPLNLVTVQAAQGRLTDAQATIGRALIANPNDPLLLMLRYDLAVSVQDFRAAQEFANDFSQRQQGPIWREQIAVMTGFDALTQGHLTQNEQRIRTGISLAEARSAGGPYLLYTIGLAWSDMVYRHHPSVGLARISKALARHPLTSLPATDRPYSTLAWFYAAAGRPADAERLLREYAQAVPSRKRFSFGRSDYEQFGARGAIAVAQHRLQDAIPYFRAYYDSSGCTVCGLFELAQVYDRLDQTDSALAILRRYADTPGIGRVEDDPGNLARTYKRLGELYEARGDRANAMTYYGKLVDLWKDADPELQPVVRDVKSRIARLAGER